MHKLLGKLGYTISKDTLSADDERKLTEELTIKTTVLPAYRSFQKPQIYKLYYHNKTHYFLPRFYAMEKYGQPEYVSLSEGVPIDVPCEQEPLPHQATAMKKLAELFNPNKLLGDGGVLSLPCGYGKTFCAIKTICSYLKRAALIIVPTECLMEQWMDAINKFTNGKAKVGYIQQDHVDVEGKDFVVAMLHSLCLKDYPCSIFDRFGIVVFDECHHIGSELFRKAMMKIRTKFTLGLSATPTRRDGLSVVFHHFIGPLFHREKRAGNNRVIIKKLILHSNDEHYTKLTMSNGTINTAGMTTAIAQFAERTRLILFTLKELIGQGRKILLLSSRKQHLHDIKDQLDTMSLRRSDGKYVTYGFYYGKSGMTRTAHKKILAESAKCDIILGIDVIAKEGLDIPDLNTLVFGTPPGIEVEQPVGRILRKFHKDFPPLVIDLVDKAGNYGVHSKERDKWYKEEECNIHEKEFNLDAKAWEGKLCEYLHKMQPQATVLPVKETAPAPAPDFNECVLDISEPIRGKPKITPKVMIKLPITGEKSAKGETEIDLNCCRLVNSKIENDQRMNLNQDFKIPNLNKCML